MDPSFIDFSKESHLVEDSTDVQKMRKAILSRKEIIEVILFLAILFALVLLINYFYIKTLEEKSTAFRRQIMFEDYFNNNSQVDYLFLGSCRTSYSVNPLYINNSYNYAFNGESPVKGYYKLKKIIDMNITIKNAVFEVHPGVLSTWAENNGWLFNEVFVFSRFVPYKEISKIRKQSVISLWIEANFPVFGKGTDFRYLFSESRYGDLYLGWLALNGNLSNMSQESINLGIQGAIHENKEQKLISEIELDYFLKSINLAHDNNISVIIIKYPWTKEFAMAVEKADIPLEESYEVLFKKIKFNYTIMDYTTSYYNYSYFFADIDHLNLLGAENFSKQLSRDLERLSLQKNK